MTTRDALEQWVGGEKRVRFFDSEGSAIDRSCAGRKFGRSEFREPFNIQKHNRMLAEVD